MTFQRPQIIVALTAFATLLVGALAIFAATSLLSSDDITTAQSPNPAIASGAGTTLPNLNSGAPAASSDVTAAINGQAPLIEGETPLANGETPQTTADTQSAIQSNTSPSNNGRIPIIFDTDANNEIDDQLALAYMLLNQDRFDVIGVTTNDTGRGGPIARHTQEAQYVVDLVGMTDTIPVIEGVDAGGTFANRQGQLGGSFQGQEAVDFIITEAKKYSPENKLVLAPVGKITNIALALAKDPTIEPNVKILALAGNYTNSGAGCSLGQDCESNLYRGAPGFNYILDSDVEFEMFPALPASGQGSAAIKVSAGELRSNLAGQGPTVSSIASPRGPSFTNVGDYMALLFANANGKPIYDTAPIAALIDPSFGNRIEIRSPSYESNGRRWIERPNNAHTIAYWDFLKTDAIKQDIYRSFQNPVLS